jgi:hypothetical protein
VRGVRVGVNSIGTCRGDYVDAFAPWSSPRTGIKCDEVQPWNVMQVIAREGVVGHRRQFVFGKNLVGDAQMADHNFAYDLTLDEARRRSAVVAALGDDWDPVAVLAEEDLAYDMLYSNLDDEQQRIYEELVRAGILPDRATRHIATDLTTEHEP